MTHTQKIATYVTSFISLSVVVISIGLSLSRQETQLFPGDKSKLHWFESTEPAEPSAENFVKVEQSGRTTESARFSFYISPTKEQPYTSYIIYFADPKSVDDLVDLSAYTDISFKIKCQPKNILVFALYSYAEGFTTIDKPDTYRVSPDFFTCNDQFKELSFELERLDSAMWWVERYGVKYNNLDADLQKVHGIAFNNSLQSPRGIDSDFILIDLKLIKKNSAYLYMAIAFVIVIWLAGSIILAKLYIEQAVRTAKTKINDNRPLMAYQQLSIQQKDESLKAKLLRHVAAEYYNPDIAIDGVAELLGTNRIKINEILKSELGLTFTAYINKLRLTEAARLLSLQKKISVKQIAFEVGFSNVTYFNTLFKKEYGCTPKAFADSTPEV